MVAGYGEGYGQGAGWAQGARGESGGGESEEVGVGGEGCQGTEGGGPSKLASGSDGPRLEQILSYSTF